jgi:hypothetical protein
MCVRHGASGAPISGPTLRRKADTAPPGLCTLTLACTDFTSSPPHSHSNMRKVRPVRGSRMLVMNRGSFPHFKQHGEVGLGRISVSRTSRASPRPAISRVAISPSGDRRALRGGQRWGGTRERIAQHPWKPHPLLMWGTLIGALHLAR